MLSYPSQVTGIFSLRWKCILAVTRIPKQSRKNVNVLSTWLTESNGHSFTWVLSISLAIVIMDMLSWILLSWIGSMQWKFFLSYSWAVTVCFELFENANCPRTRRRLHTIHSPVRRKWRMQWDWRWEGISRNRWYTTCTCPRWYGGELSMVTWTMEMRSEDGWGEIKNPITYRKSDLKISTRALYFFILCTLTFWTLSNAKKLQKNGKGCQLDNSTQRPSDAVYTWTFYCCIRFARNRNFNLVSTQKLCLQMLRSLTLYSANGISKESELSDCSANFSLKYKIASSR